MVWNKKSEKNEIIKSDVEQEKKVDVKKIFEEFLDYILQSNELNMIDRDIKTKENLLKETYYRLIDRGLSKEDSKLVLKELEESLWKYGKINKLIENEPSITDIKLMAYGNVRCKRNGKREDTDVKFESRKEMEQFIKRVAVRNGVSLSQINSQITFTDEETYKEFILRITISEKYVNSEKNSYMHIRKERKDKICLDELEKLGMIKANTKKYLINSVKEGKNIVIVGKGSSGKTTLLNALIEEIPHDKAGLIIQENKELFSKTHPEIMSQQVRISRGEGKINYTLKDLSITGLLMDVDYYIIGEIKGAEAKYFQNAFYTGYSAWSTIHGVSSTKGLEKMVDYMKYETDYSRTDLLRMLAHIDTVIFMEDFILNELSEVTGFDDSKNELTYKTIIKGGQDIDIY